MKKLATRIIAAHLAATGAGFLTNLILLSLFLTLWLSNSIIYDWIVLLYAGMRFGGYFFIPLCIAYIPFSLLLCLTLRNRNSRPLPWMLVSFFFPGLFFVGLELLTYGGFLGSPLKFFKIGLFFSPGGIVAGWVLWKFMSDCRIQRDVRDGRASSTST